MPALPARRALELAAMSRQRLDESARAQCVTVETLLVGRDAIVHSRALLSELHRVCPREERRGEEAAPEPEGAEPATR